MIYNGELLEWQPSEDLYLYQNIHTLDYEPWHLKHHIDILNLSAEKLFGNEATLSELKIRGEIELLLDRSRLTRNVSICVVLRLYSTGDYSLHVGQVGIYRGYVMRSLRPVAICLKMGATLSNYPTSALKASHDLAHQIASAKDCHEAIMIDEAGFVVEDPLRPVAIINQYTLTMPSPELCSVECLLMERAAEKHGLKVAYSRITQEQIEQADEVLMMTHQGITSVERIGQKYYYSTLADKIASNLESVEIKN